MGARRRVVVTGLGVLSCAGNGTKATWNGVLSGKSFISRLSGKEYNQLPCRIAGLVTGLHLEKRFSKEDFRSLSRGSMLALVAAEEAINDSQLPLSEAAQLVTGVAIGMTMSTLEDVCSYGTLLDKGLYKKISPHAIPRIITNSPAGVVSIKYGLKGPNHAVATACATGLHAVGDAYRFIERGDADAMVCGGTEGSVTPLSLAGFCRLRALCTTSNDSPHTASRPFDAARNGFVMSEGAGIVVLEELERAKARGAPMYGEIIGYGLSGDGHHQTAPCPRGDGALRAMRAALRDVDPGCVIGHVNAHATSTSLGDEAESSAIAAAIETRGGEQSLVSSVKGSLGHMVGAAGSVEFAIAVLACKYGVVPPNANLEKPSVSAPLRFVRGEAKEWKTKHRVALTNSFGFGGVNASVCVQSMGVPRTFSQPLNTECARSTC